MACARCDAKIESDSVDEVLAWDDAHDAVCPALHPVGADS